MTPVSGCSDSESVSAMPSGGTFSPNAAVQTIGRSRPIWNQPLPTMPVLFAPPVRVVVPSSATVDVPVRAVGLVFAVLNVTTPPNAAPPGFDAIAHTKYVTPGLSPVSATENGAADVPMPNAMPPIAGTRVPKVSSQLAGMLLEYRNQPVPAVPPGFAVPLSVASCAVRSVVGPVVTIGKGASTVKVSTWPKAVPTTFEEIAQK